MTRGVLVERFRRDRSFQHGRAAAAVLAAVALAPWLRPHDSFRRGLSGACLLESVGWYLFGTDTSGPDVRAWGKRCAKRP